MDHAYSAMTKEAAGGLNLYRDDMTVEQAEFELLPRRAGQDFISGGCPSS
jgi:hypothetical protein